MVNGSLRKVGRYLRPMDTSSHQRRAGPILVRTALFALLMPLGLAASALAQPPAADQPAPTDRPARADVLPQGEQKTLRERDLEAVREEQRNAAETETKLRAEIASIGEDRTRLNRALIETAARIRELETRIATSEGRIKTLDDNERTIRRSLEDRRDVIAEVLAALQRIGRRPPPALMVRPEDALQSVRTAMMLGAVLPEMRIEAEALVADLTELVRVRQEIAAEIETTSGDLAALSQDRQRMTLLVEERQRKQAETERALETERERAAALARQADSLKDLIAKFEQDIAASARAAEAAARATAKEPATSGRPNLAALKDPGRLAPAVAFATAKGALPLPVNGVKVREFGAADRLGGTEKGLSIVTRPGAQVTAPCDGWVVYAGPFRSYGQLLILNAGGGYHVLLAGMERISVDLGQFVLTGEPVAVMGAGSQTAALVAVGSSQPVLYVEFRKDGIPVDPSPWWANDSEKVRG
jgi:septal ring factor EnvC (AmiA/AmiB activator)